MLSLIGSSLLASRMGHEYVLLMGVVFVGLDIDSMVRFGIVLSKNEIVFARTSPKHKLEIVKRAQALGHIVGV